MWGTSGIGYNAGKVKEILGDNAPVDSWALVLEEENAKKLAACGITILDDPTDVMAIMLTYMGKDPHKATMADWRAAAKRLKKIAPYVRNFNSSQFVDELASGQPVSLSPTPAIPSRRQGQLKRPTMATIFSMSFQKRAHRSGTMFWRFRRMRPTKRVPTSSLTT